MKPQCSPLVLTWEMLSVTSLTLELGFPRCQNLPITSPNWHHFALIIHICLHLFNFYFSLSPLVKIPLRVGRGGHVSTRGEHWGFTRLQSAILTGKSANFLILFQPQAPPSANMRLESTSLGNQIKSLCFSIKI